VHAAPHVRAQLRQRVPNAGRQRLWENIPVLYITLLCRVIYKGKVYHPTLTSQRDIHLTP